MRLKFAVLAICVGLFAAAAVRIVYIGTPPYYVAAQDSRIELLPETLAGAQQKTYWRNHLRGTVVENGAIYGPVSGTRIMLDFFRGRSRQHNGIACFIARGNTLDSKNTRTLATAGGPVVFAVAHLSSRGGSRLIASAQCTAGGCGPGRAGKTQHPTGLNIRMRNFFARSASVVPVTITVMPSDNATPSQATEEHLRHILARAAATLDLRPAQHLAAVQEGAGAVHKAEN